MNAANLSHVAARTRTDGGAPTAGFPSTARDAGPATDGERRHLQEDTRTFLRIVAADGDPDARRFYEEAVPRLGHEVCVAQTGPQLVEQCRLLRPDLIVADVRLPGMDAIAATDEICRERPTAVVLVSDAYEPLWVARALGNDCILAYLPKPVGEGALGAALAVAARRFGRMESWRAETAGARQALEDRKLIERAKGAVVRYVGVDEEEAYRRLRKLASDDNRKLAETAHEVLASAEVFRALGQADGERSGDGGGLRAKGVNGAHPASAPRRHAGYRVGR